MIIAIDSLNDARLDGYRALPARTDARSDTIIVESELAVTRLLESDVRVHSVLALDKRAATISALAPDVTIYALPQWVLDAVVGFTMNRGAIALADRPKRALGTLRARLAGPALLVAASRVSDPANLGSIVRNCRALGASGLIVDPAGADVYARKTVRTAMGHTFSQSVVVHDLVAGITTLREAAPDLRVVAATLSPKAVDVGAYSRTERTLLVVGNEGNGIAADVLALADDQVVIPMHDGTDSLNVAAASAVLLYALKNHARPR